MPTIAGIIVATGTESSGRRTLLDVIDDLARPINASDTTVRALCADAFRSAVRTMNRKGMWPWELQEENITITANNAYSTLTGAVKKPLAMHLLDQSGGTPYQPIDYMSYDRFIEQFSLNVSGQPSIYTIPNLFETGQVRWHPKPSTTLYAQFAYYRMTPAPRTESEAVEIPDYAIEAYMSFARYELAKRLPASQVRMPLGEARLDAKLAFRELSAHIASPGDRSRVSTISGLG